MAVSGIIIMVIMVIIAIIVAETVTMERTEGLMRTPIVVAISTVTMTRVCAQKVQN